MRTATHVSGAADKRQLLAKLQGMAKSHAKSVLVLLHEGPLPQSLEMLDQEIEGGTTTCITIHQLALALNSDPKSAAKHVLSFCTVLEQNSVKPKRSTSNEETLQGQLRLVFSQSVEGQRERAALNLIPTERLADLCESLIDLWKLSPMDLQHEIQELSDETANHIFDAFHTFLAHDAVTMR